MGSPTLVDKGLRLSTHRRGDADTSLAGANSRSSLAIRLAWVTPVASSGRSWSGPGHEPRSPAEACRATMTTPVTRGSLANAETTSRSWS